MTQHRNGDVPIIRGKTHDISLIITPHQARIKPARQAAAIAKRNTLTICYFSVQINYGKFEAVDYRMTKSE